ncbi:MAG: four helix bundle protein [Patescibacteria group bacterium]
MEQKPQYKNLLFEKADPIAKEIFKLTLNFDHKLQFSIGDQLRRSSLSVVLNIVEGGARKSPKEKKQFLNITFGSLKETKYLIYFCHDLKLIDNKIFEDLMLKINELAKIIYVLVYRK